MNYFGVVSIEANWGKRREDVASVAERLGEMLSRMAEISASFRGWSRDGLRNRSTVPLLITMPPQISEICDWLNENKNYEKRNGHKVHTGYEISAKTYKSDEFWARISLLDDFEGEYTWLRKKIVISIDIPKTNPERLCPIVRPVLSALVRAWDPEWAAVAPSNYDFRISVEKSNFLIYPGGWMVYLDQEHAERIAERRDVASERLQNGGVLLTATDELFDVRDNAAHRAAASRIQEALAPLNFGP